MSSLIQITPPPNGDHDPALQRTARQSDVDLSAIRERLEQAKGPRFWKSLEELSETDEFRKFVDDEFPERAPDWSDPAKRRTFLKIMGASLALAGVSACTKQPPESIVPYVKQPEELTPGKPLFYATARPAPGGAIGILVESHMGRPTKIEGNPSHPGSLGAADAFTQASILDLYDPDRSQSVTRNGNVSSWGNFMGTLIAQRDEFLAKQGAGLTILTEPVNSPTLAAQIKQFQTLLPQAKWRVYTPVSRPVTLPTSIYRLESADVIVSLDSDFLGCGGDMLRLSREFAAKRRVLVNEKNTMNRLYVAEGTPSVTGGAADHRIRVRTLEVPIFAAELAKALGVGAGAAGLSAAAAKVIPALAKDLQEHRGASVIMAGDYQPAEVHALAHAMNQALGNVGKTVTYLAPPATPAVDTAQSIRELVADMNGGRVETILILGGNPVYDAPADVDFGAALKKVRTRVHLGSHHNETARICHWHIPETHYLETWSDIRAYDGTVTIMQPLIAPLYEGISIHQIFQVLLNKVDQKPHETVKNYWRTQASAGDFNSFWQRTLHDGVAPNTALATADTLTLPAPGAIQAPAAGALEIVFRPDASVWDGRYANNGWMQEMPRPETKMTWDNAVWISPTTAARLNLKTENVVELKYKNRSVRGPIWIIPGHADDSVTVHLGYGRWSAGNVGTGVGFNAYAIRTADASWAASGVEIQSTSDSYSFASIQRQHDMDHREPVKLMSLADYIRNPKVESEAPAKDMSMFPEWEYSGYKWGMSIDLNACTGCSACMVACQAENNIPVVGKDQVARHRHMAWIRVDRYYHGRPEDPEWYSQPVPCMHCETAPCELVCPVAATVHSGDGLNQMVYNRCVGTRYCSNNCPYKVRRFNFYLYSDWYTESLHGLRNPDVTVRSRGVMEKCTYCVQRINSAKIESEKEDRRIVDGEIVTACQQACPTQAIIFGDLNDPKSRIAKMKSQPRDYGLLEDLNTRPRTTYLARLRNPNPEIEKG